MSIREIARGVFGGEDPGAAERLCQHRVRLHLPGARTVVTRALVSETLLSLALVYGTVEERSFFEHLSGTGERCQALFLGLEGEGAEEGEELLICSRQAAGGVVEIRIEASPEASALTASWELRGIPCAQKSVDPAVDKKSASALPPFSDIGLLPRGGVLVYEPEMRFRECILRPWLYGFSVDGEAMTCSGIRVEYAKGVEEAEPLAYYTPIIIGQPRDDGRDEGGADPEMPDPAKVPISFRITAIRES